MPDSADFIIRAGSVVPCPWHICALEASASDDAASAARDTTTVSPPAQRLPVLPFSTWRDRETFGGTAPHPLSLPAAGLWLDPADEPGEIAALLAGDINRLPVIAVHFPRFVDGRGYSHAALLRTRYGYRGPLLAFGDLGRDQLWQLQRVGFDAFALRAGSDLHDALAAFHDFPERYQGSVDEPLPLFRRRSGEASHV